MSYVENAQSKSDEQLYAIIASLHEYQPEAADAFKAEFQRRNLDPARVRQIETVIKTEKHELDTAQLTLWEKIRCIINPFSIFRIEAYRARGQMGKYNQAWKFVIIGLLVWLFLIAWRVLLFLSQ